MFVLYLKSIIFHSAITICFKSLNDSSFFCRMSCILFVFNISTVFSCIYHSHSLIQLYFRPLYINCHFFTWSQFCSFILFLFSSFHFVFTKHFSIHIEVSISLLQWNSQHIDVTEALRFVSFEKKNYLNTVRSKKRFFIKTLQDFCVDLLF